jgi:hypothetical protein
VTEREFAGAGLSDARRGTGLDDSEVAASSAAVDIDALLRYRRAVRKETLSWLAACDLASHDERADSSLHRGAEAGVSNPGRRTRGTRLPTRGFNARYEREVAEYGMMQHMPADASNIIPPGRDEHHDARTQ